MESSLQDQNAKGPIDTTANQSKQSGTTRPSRFDANGQGKKQA